MLSHGGILSNCEGAQEILDSIVKNDTEKSFKMLNKNGIILWHDYVPGKQSAKNVVNYLNVISKEKNILNIRNTSLCVFRNSD